MSFPLFSPNKMLQVTAMEAVVPQSVLQALSQQLFSSFPRPCSSHLFPAPSPLLRLDPQRLLWSRVMSQTDTKSPFSSMKLCFQLGSAPYLLVLCRVVPAPGSRSVPGKGSSSAHPATGNTAEPPQAVAPVPSAKQEQAHSAL